MSLKSTRHSLMFVIQHFGIGSGRMGVRGQLWLDREPRIGIVSEKCSKTKPVNLKPSPRPLETERMCAGLMRLLGSCGHSYIHLCLRCPSLIKTAACYVCYKDMGPVPGHKDRRGTMPWPLTRGTMQVRIKL